MPNFLGALDWNIGDTLEIGRRRARGGRQHPSAHGGGGGGHQSPGMNMRQAAFNRANMAASFARPDMPGTPSLDAALLPAAFPLFSFALATGTNQIQQTMNPQAAFRGQRLTAVVIRNGSSASLTAPLLNLLQVGMKPIILTSSGVPLEAYTAQSFDNNLLLPPTVPGVIYVMNLSLPIALTTTDTIIAIVQIVGSGVL